MLDISGKIFKIVKHEEGGVIAIIIVKKVDHNLKGTRSEQVHYKVLVKSEIFGKTDKFNSIVHYGKPRIILNQKYLVVLRDLRLGLVLLDFQQLFCDDCNEVIVACKKKLNKY